MAETTEPNSYLEEMKRLQNEAVSTLLEQALSEKDYANAQTAAALKSTNRSAYADYLDYVNPYGTQSESLASAGLGHSGAAEKNYANSYNAYQSALAKAASAAQSEQDDTNQSYLSTLASGNAQKLSNEADYYQNLYDNYWNQKQMDYYNSLLQE
ncbi:MAG: hypothetical protein ACC608_03895 [Anaerofustis sp.]